MGTTALRSKRTLVHYQEKKHFPLNQKFEFEYILKELNFFFSFAYVLKWK